jgi:hypothetical protein
MVGILSEIPQICQDRWIYQGKPTYPKLGHKMRISLSGGQTFAPRSMARVPFCIPLAILPLKWGGSELTMQVSTAWIGKPESTVKVGFQTPFAYLPLIGGGGRIGGLK